jgi:hypothetical protein
MTPQELVQQIKDELADALNDLDLSRRLQVLDIAPPAQLDAETSLTVTIAATGGRIAELALPTSLAIGYLADEEAAVDEWRHWVQDIATHFAP